MTSHSQLGPSSGVPSDPLSPFQLEAASASLRQGLFGVLCSLLAAIDKADQRSQGVLLRRYSGRLEPVFAGLFAVLLRTGYVLFAESRGLLPAKEENYANALSLLRLHQLLAKERGGLSLRERFQAWPQVLRLFRLLHQGGNVEAVAPIPSGGALFDPDEFPFLEGRSSEDAHPGEMPFSDEEVFQLLQGFVVPGAASPDFTTVDVDMLCTLLADLARFGVQRAQGESVALLPDHTVVNLEELAGKSGAERIQILKDSGISFPLRLEGEVKVANNVDALRHAFARRMSPHYSQKICRGQLFVRTTRRWTSTWSYHTPPDVVRPIVAAALRPILERLASTQSPSDILDIAVCDPMMGAGAFLLESCRQLADALVLCWQRGGDPSANHHLLLARYQIAARCIYGVDRNPLAVRLARMGLTLLTLSRQCSGAFVEHSLRSGDSLIGLSRAQIENLAIEPTDKSTPAPISSMVKVIVESASLQRQILKLAAKEPGHDGEVTAAMQGVEHALVTPALIGDAMLAALFSERSKADQREAIERVVAKIATWLVGSEFADELHGMTDELQDSLGGARPFHFQIVFPEVFVPGRNGFDVLLGDTPFLGAKSIASSLGSSYLSYLTSVIPEINPNVDLAIYFLRRSYELLRPGGSLGLLLPTSLAAGENARWGLGWIVEHGGTIYRAEQQHLGSLASVIVAAVHIVKEAAAPPPCLNGLDVPVINAHLLPLPISAEPRALPENADLAYRGLSLGGTGFLIEDQTAAQRMLMDSQNQQVLFPFLTGEQLVSSPGLSPQRYVIDLGDRSLEEAQGFPELFSLLTNRVKPERDSRSRTTGRSFWQHMRSSASLQEATRTLQRVLVCPRYSRQLIFAFCPPSMRFSEQIFVFALEDAGAFSILQSRLHEAWAQSFSPVLNGDLAYSITGVFYTFPWPHNWKKNSNLKELGEAYLARRSELMQQMGCGLGRLYARFHSADEQSPELLALRQLHHQIDQTVLAAYGWQDVQPACEFRPGPGGSERLAWTDQVRFEVLTRLLSLNAERADSSARIAHRTKSKAQPKGQPIRLLRITTKDLAPSEFDIRCAPRLNLLTGDNGLGKSVLLDLAYYGLTGVWARQQLLPRRGEDVAPVIRCEFNGAPPLVAAFLFKELRFVRSGGPDSTLVIYAKADGGFEVWDSLRSSVEIHAAEGPSPGHIRFTRDEVWDGVSRDGAVLSNGLLRDWLSWEFLHPPLFLTFTQVLEALAPMGGEAFRPGKPMRISPSDAREIPTIVLPYGEVPVTMVSAGMRRILALAYVLVLTHHEHLVAAAARNQAPLENLVLLIDEAESHLHPQWQRSILPSILQSIERIAEKLSVQLIVSTHSPLVMASVEPFFDEEQDALLHFELRDGKIVAEERTWAKEGDAVNWLVSGVFGLRQARSREAEQAIEAAEAFMRGAPLPLGLETKEEIHEMLLRVLPGHDSFWPRWIVRTGSIG